MLVTVRLFARLRELAGASELRRELPDGATARTAWDSLVRELRGARRLRAGASRARSTTTTRG